MTCVADTLILKLQSSLLAGHANISKSRPDPLLFFLLFTFTMSPTQACSSLCKSSPIKPTTPLVAFLEQIQETALQVYGTTNFDPKEYVDVSLKFNLSKTQAAYSELIKSSVSVQQLDDFMGTFFKGAGKDLEYHDPVDFVAKPQGFLPKVENPEVREWALEVHSLWKNLSRRVTHRVVENPELHTLLPLPGPVIIPGSRFREVYYWDSYWVIRGLLVSKMYDTANSIVYNLISLIDEYGYVLNGARAYYSNRSQPPLLSAMVVDIYKATQDLSLVKKALPALLKEHQFWNSGIHKVVIQDAESNNHTVNRYFAMWDKPRPEGSTIDKESASKLLNASEKQHFYRELASTAESGWDFSTRWMRNESDLTTLATTSILPVDLNAYILKMELDISFLAKTIGENPTAEQFKKTSQARRKAFNSIFWNAEKGQWLDYWVTDTSACEKVHKWDAQNQNKNTFASNFVPLWIDSFNSDDATVEEVMGSLQNSGLVCPSGIATSLSNSGLQWDFPNGWAPLHHMIVEGLSKSGSKDVRSIAEDIAIKWLKTNYVAYKKTGAMHEKYDVRACGSVGGGGFYNPQTGFGWSNGVVLAFLEEFGWPQEQKIEC